MTIVTDAIAEFTEQVTRVIDPPAGDLGYGTDMWCADDLAPDMAEVPGDSPIAVAQSNYRRLLTPRGSIPDAPDDGIDLRSFLHEPMTQKRQQEVASIIRSELRKDDRNETIEVAFRVASLREMQITVTGTLADSRGSFVLVMALTDSELLLKEMQANGNA